MINSYIANIILLFKKYIDIDYTVKFILPEFTFFISALLLDFYIRKRFLKKLILSEVFLIKDLQSFGINFLSRAAIILIFSFSFSIIKNQQAIFLNQIAMSVVIFGFFKFLSHVADNNYISKLGMFLTIVSFIYSLDVIKISSILSNIKFDTVLFETNLFVIIKILVKLSIFYCIISVNEKILKFILPKFSDKPHSARIVKMLLKYFLYTLLILNLSTNIGIKASHLAMIGSAIGIGIGFGFQKFASNFISGLIIMSENKFKIGDSIILEDGTWGIIIEIDTRTTMIQTLNQEKMLIPNETMLNSIIKNLTLENHNYNIKIDFKIKLDSDLKQAIKIAQNILDDLSKKGYILPNPSVKVDSILNDGILLYARLFFNDVNALEEFNPWTVKSNFFISLQENFKLNNIEFANFKIISSY